jgi:hypothetical protein
MDVCRLRTPALRNMNGERSVACWLYEREE